MAIQSTLSISLVAVGNGDNNQPSAQSVNANAPPQFSIILQNGWNQVAIPGSPYTVNAIVLRPLSTSTNQKAYAFAVTPSPGAVGDPAVYWWTNQAIVVPVAAGETGVSLFIYSQSLSIDPVEINWA